MLIRLSTVQDSENVINKIKNVKHEIEITLKNDVSLSSPTIVLSDKKGVLDFTTCNYCEMVGFERFYFIRNIVGSGGGLWSFDLEVDVLESFKEDILNSMATYQSKIGNNDYGYITNDETRTTRNHTIYKGDIVVDRGRSVIISTLGGID